MATLTFNSKNINGPQLAWEIMVGVGLSSLPAVGYVSGSLAVTHPNISAGNQSAIQTVITNHIADVMWGITVADLKPFVVTLNGGAPLVWTNMPLALTSATGTETKVPLYTAQIARLTCRVLVAGAAAAVLIAQVSLDGVNYVNGPQVPVASTGLKVSSIVAIPDQYQTDVFFRIAGQGGNGTADPSFGLTTITFG